MTVYVRAFKNQERELLQALRDATSVPVQIVQRAKLVLRSAEKAEAATIAQELKLSVGRVRAWIARFNSAGLLGLFDCPRCGRPRSYSAEQALRVVGVATTTPTTLQVPFQQWSLSHLQRYLKEEEVGEFLPGDDPRHPTRAWDQLPESANVGAVRGSPLGQQTGSDHHLLCRSAC